MGCDTEDCAELVRGPKGDPGVSSYLYFAYASASDGTGFSLVPDDSLPYISSVILQKPATLLTVNNFPKPFQRYLGAPGIDGRGYDATSSTSLTIVKNVGITLTISLNKAYVAGSYVRIVSRADATNFMEGFVIGYDPSTGVMLVAINNSGGSGTFSDWNLSIAGRAGTNSVIILFNDLSQPNSGDTLGVLTKIKTDNIPANTLKNDGDTISIMAVLKDLSTVFTHSPFAKIRVGTASLMTGFASFSSTNQVAVINITIDRITSTTYLVTTSQAVGIGGTVDTLSEIVTAADFTAVIPVEYWAQTNGDAGGITLNKLYAEYKQIS